MYVMGYTCIFALEEFERVTMRSRIAIIKLVQAWKHGLAGYTVVNGGGKAACRIARLVRQGKY